MSDRGKIYVSIVTPEEVTFEGEVDFLSIPSRSGSMGILYNHVPVVCQLKSGLIKLKSGEKSKYFAVGSGYMEFINDSASIITGKAIETTYENREEAIKETKKKHDIVQEISDETKKVLEAITYLKGLRK